MKYLGINVQHTFSELIHQKNTKYMKCSLSLSPSLALPVPPLSPRFMHILYNSHTLLIFVGFHFKGRVLLWFVFLFSVLAILLEVIFLIVWAILGPEWELADAWWIKLIGLMK